MMLREASDAPHVPFVHRALALIQHDIKITQHYLMEPLRAQSIHMCTGAPETHDSNLRGQTWD